MSNTYDWRTPKVQTLLKRREDLVKEANRAERLAAESRYFGDEVEASMLLLRAHDARLAASMCANEAEYLRGGAFDSSAQMHKAS